VVVFADEAAQQKAPSQLREMSLHLQKKNQLKSLNTKYENFLKLEKIIQV